MSSNETMGEIVIYILQNLGVFMCVWGGGGKGGGCRPLLLLFFLKKHFPPVSSTRK